MKKKQPARYIGKKIYWCNDKIKDPMLGETYCIVCGKTVTVYCDINESEKLEGANKVWICPHCQTTYEGHRTSPEVTSEDD